MALTLNHARKYNAVRVISKHDEAVDHEASDWSKYAEDPVANEKAIVMKEGETATYFLCNFELSGKESAQIKDALISGVDDEKNLKMSYGKWAYKVVQLTLKAIENPPGVSGVIEYKKDGRGYVSDATMDLLEQVGVVQEIFEHYTNLKLNNEARDNSKN